MVKEMPIIPKEKSKPTTSPVVLPTARPVHREHLVGKTKTFYFAIFMLKTYHFCFKLGSFHNNLLSQEPYIIPGVPLGAVSTPSDATTRCPIRKEMVYFSKHYTHFFSLTQGTSRA